MKNLLTLVFVTLAFSAAAQTPSLIGRWKASPRGETIYLELGKDSSFVFSHNKDTLGGKNFIFGEGPATTAFQADTNQKPMHLNLLVIETSSGKVINKMEGIFEFVGPDKLRIRMSIDGSNRPSSFLPRGNEETVLLVRQK